MDCQMPVMDGYQATREIRRREAGTRHVPIIAVTAHAMLGAAEECIAAGMDAYQSKPLDRQRLQECLETLLAPPVAEQQPAALADVAAPDRHGLRDVVEAAEPMRPVDWAQVRRVSGGDRQFVAELTTTFVASSAAALGQIDAALENFDFESLQRAAHSLKGAAGSVGAALCEALAGTLEAVAQQRDSMRARSLAVQLAAAIEEAGRLLETAV
jgi:CheY-like chemotaxis protein/HPt (histidine-containing phosphotransfer) domain-containing protein